MLPTLRAPIRFTLTYILLLSASAFADNATVPIPIPVAERVASVETTARDIGAPALLFDNDPRTLIRTPSINPAYVEVEFTEPISFEIFRVQIWARSDYTLAAADNLADLRSKSGSYRVLIPTRENGEKGWGQVTFDEPVTARAFRLDTTRKEGDDYVHISEMQFCRPGQVEDIVLHRVVDRRMADQPQGQEPVDGPIETWVQTVVWIKAAGIAGGATLELADNVAWEALDAGVEPFGQEKGMFLLTEPGAHRVRVKTGDFEKTITLVAKPRQLLNREPDIEIAYIERLPRIDYPPADNEDPRAGWPKPGAEVTWRGHLYNWGTSAVDARYIWKLDGRVVNEGEVTIPVGPPHTDFTTVDLPWKWEFARHDVTLTIRPTAPLDELNAVNNELTIQTDAITVGFYVEQSIWEFHHEHQYRLPTRDANSFAGWSQRMMARWNNMFREAVFPGIFPDGIVERVRLDRLVIVPDFALPLAGGIPSNNPNLADKTIDMQWGHEEITIRPPYHLPAKHWWSPDRTLNVFASGRVDAEKEDPPFWCGLGFIHEMAHARYLVDAYGFNVHTGHGENLSERTIPIKVDGKPLFGTYMRWEDDIQHWRKYPGQMGGDYWHWSLFDAMCWNRRAGWRARGGNCNSPPTIGEFLQDIPTRCIYKYVDQAGNPLANADVRIYQARGTGKDWYSKLYPAEPDLRATTASDGTLILDRTLWSADGVIRHTYGHANGVALVQVIHDGQHYFLFEEVTDANIAYNLGHHDQYTFVRQIKLRDAPPSPSEWDVDNRWEPLGGGFSGRR